MKLRARWLSILLLCCSLAGCDIMRGFELSTPAPAELDPVALQAALQQNPAHVAASSQLWDGRALQLFFRRQDAVAVFLYHRDDGVGGLRLYSLGIGWRPSPTQLARCVALQLEIYESVRQHVSGLPPPEGLTEAWHNF